MPLKVALILTLSALSLASDPGVTGSACFETVMTQNLDPSHEEGTAEEWRAQTPSEVAFEARVLLASDTDQCNFLILMPPGLADTLGTELVSRWTADIAAQGLSVEVHEVTYSFPFELRSYLHTIYMEEQGLEGAVLVGDLPVPWTDLDNSFLKYSESFPTDYFYMDLDGEWLDEWIGPPSSGVPGSDGNYDTWTGDLAPEIYVGRIKTDNLPMAGTELDLMNAYFDRNHTWRDEGDTIPTSALCYVDDDWAYWGSEYLDAMQEVYPNTELISDQAATNGTDYVENRLQGNHYTWISPYVHSSSQMHQWSPGPSTWNSQVYAINPQARFYNLFACSNARFTSDNHMGGIYTFGTSAGLGAIGSTKSGSMLDFMEFYAPLGSGENLGEAYLAWWTHITDDGFTDWEKSWFLGMVLLGDPSLTPSVWVPAADYGVSELQPAMQLTLHPNPCMGSLSISTGVDLSVDISIHDLSGRMILESTCETAVTSHDLSGLPAGLYVISAVSDRGHTATSTLIITH